MIKNQITIVDNNIGAYIEKSEGRIKLGKKELRRENKKLKRRVFELENELQSLKDKCLIIRDN